MKKEFSPYDVVSNTEKEIILEFKGAKLRMAQFTFRVMPVLFIFGFVLSLYFLNELDENLPWFVNLLPFSLLLCAFLMLAESSVVYFSINHKQLTLKKNTILKSKRELTIYMADVRQFSVSRNGRRFDLVAELFDGRKISVLRFPYLYKTIAEMEMLKERFNFQFSIFFIC